MPPAHAGTWLAPGCEPVAIGSLKLAARGDPASVLVVDDHEIVREGLRAILHEQERLHIVAVANDGDDACRLAAALLPDIVVMDVSMPGLNGSDATRRLLIESPASKVIALTAHEEPPYVRELLAAGARGYVLKRTLVRHLIHAIDVVIAGGVYLDPNLAQQSARPVEPERTALLAELTPREVAVASMAASGHSNAEIAAAQHIAIKTVEAHKARLMAKLGLSTRAQLVRYAIYRGWLSR